MVTKKALWVDGWSNPPWAKAMVNLMTSSKLPSHRGYCTTDSQEIVQPNRLPEGNSRRRNFLPSSAISSKQDVQGGGGSICMRSANTSSGAIATDTFTWVNILKQCLKQEDFPAVKQVHECALESGMHQNVYVANNLLSAYIRCGRLEDACRLFDELVNKDVISWNVMIGGYTQHSRARDAMEIFHQMRREGVQANEITYVNILKACASPSALMSGELVHTYIRQGGFESNVRVGTALLGMYAKCGSIEKARTTFENLASRNNISWNAMIGAYAESGCGEEVYRLLLRMKQEGFEPCAITYLSILNVSASSWTLEWVRQVNSHASEAGFESDIRVGTAFLSMYAKCGSIEEARKTFDTLASRSNVAWNAMIAAYAKSGCGEEAYRLFLRMKREGFQPTAITYLSILNASASAGALEWVKEVHSHAREAGFESDVRVGNALIHMYAKCGSLDDARVLFNRMQTRDGITWNVMIGGIAQHGCGHEAFQLFLRMKREGFEPCPSTYLSILNASPSAEALEWVRELHNHAREANFESDVFVGTALLGMYAKCGSIQEARQTFENLVSRNVVSWTVMIGAYAETGGGEEAYRLFLQMKREGFQPTAITFLSILNASSSASAGALEWVKEVHRHARQAGLESDVRVCNALIHMYAKCGSIGDAHSLFNRMQTRDVITWSVMIGGLAQRGCGHEAFELLLRMKREGFQPCPITYLSILNSSADAGALEWVKRVHSHAREAGFESDVRVGTALVHMYAECGSLDDARLAFDRLEERNLITWNAMMAGLGQHGCGNEALELFGSMVAEGVKPDQYSFVALLSACSHAGLVDEGRRLFRAMSQDYGIVASLLHCNCMVDILGRAGHLEEAKLFIDSMPVEPDASTWGALLGACRSYGNVELGELAAKERLNLDPEDASTYVLLSNMYAAAEQWEKVSSVRTAMREKGIRKEPGCSWIEVDNEIHSFFAEDKSHPETKEIYAELSRLTEKIRAEGYLPDTQLVVHDVDKKDKEFSVCSHSEKLAIAYGLMHTSSTKVVYVFKNLRVCSDCHTAIKLISKVTTRELVVRDANRFHHFKGGLCSCKDYW